MLSTVVAFLEFSVRTRQLKKRKLEQSGRCLEDNVWQGPLSDRLPAKRVQDFADRLGILFQLIQNSFFFVLT
jgi:hypothetical protein